jgi:hypothetical protein
MKVMSDTKGSGSGREYCWFAALLIVLLAAAAANVTGPTTASAHQEAPAP